MGVRLFFLLKFPPHKQLTNQSGNCILKILSESLNLKWYIAALKKYILFHLFSTSFTYVPKMSNNVFCHVVLHDLIPLS